MAAVTRQGGPHEVTRAPARGRRAAPAAALLGYAALVGVLAWPLPARLGTHLPSVHVSSEYDSLFLAWALAHQTRALSRAPAEFPHGNVFHPARHALFHGETGIGALPYFAPVFLASGNPVLALNVMVLVCVTLTAWALHVVVQRWTGSHVAGFVAAATLLTTRWVLPGGIAGAPNYAVLQYFPFVVYLAADTRAGAARTVALVAAIVLQSLTSVYTAAAVFVPLGFVALVRLVRARGAAARVRLALVLVVSGLLVAPFYAGHLLIRLENPGLQEQSFFVRFTQEADLPWGPLSYWTPLGVPAAALALVAAGALVARARGGVGRSGAQAWRHAALWAAAGLLLALPPMARFRGTPLRLPQAALEPIGFYDLFRVTDRLGLAGLIGSALLAGLAFAACAPRRRARRSALAGLVAAAMLVEYLYGPQLPVIGPRRTHTYFAHVEGFPAGIGVPPYLYIVPVLALGHYPVRDVARLRADAELCALLTGPGRPVLELPVGGGRGGSPELQARAMFRSICHWRPVLNGYSRYWPAGFPELMTLARQLPDAGAVRELRRRTGLEIVVVRSGELDAAARDAWAPLLGGGGRADLALVAHHGPDVVFRVGPSAADGAVEQR
jgi:hypothetical protein